jgi:hypothetical protein
VLTYPDHASDCTYVDRVQFRGERRFAVVCNFVCGLLFALYKRCERAGEEGNILASTMVSLCFFVQLHLSFRPSLCSFHCAAFSFMLEHLRSVYSEPMANKVYAVAITV